MAIVIGIAGYSGSGKTTLLEKLISDMKQQGLKIGVIKHSSHDMDLGKKDTAKFFYSGADEVITSRAKTQFKNFQTKSMAMA